MVPASVRHPHHGPHDPAARTPSRLPGSVRRTSSIDMLRPDGMTGDLLLAGRARDICTAGDGSVAHVARASLEMTVAFLSGREVRSISSDPVRPALQALVGARAASGFRSRVADLLPAELQARSLLYLLLDDVPGATLIAGYAVGVAGRADTLSRSGHQLRAGVCAGFRPGGTMMTEIGRTGQAPTVTGPVAPRAGPGDDPQGWHELPSLPPLAMRRRRLLDVIPGPVVAVHTWFRDTYRSAAGEETVIHEYQVDAQVDPGSWRIVDITATPRVLPWTECPAAAASAGRLAGATLQDLRRDVRTHFTGTSTCTHLNDQLRSLTDVIVLAGACAPSA
jgi:hypothetical protein